MYGKLGLYHYHDADDENENGARMKRTTPPDMTAELRDDLFVFLRLLGVVGVSVGLVIAINHFMQ